jgi:transcriptional regulator with XRE-family HTH domain
MDIRTRIKARLKATGYSARTASVEAGYNTHLLQKYLSGSVDSITAEALLALAEVLETSPEWLLIGRGPEDLAPGAGELLSIYTELTEGDRKSLLDYARFVMKKPI